MAIPLVALLVSTVGVVGAAPPSHRLRGTSTIAGASESDEDAVNTSTTVTTTGKWAAEDGRVCKKDKANCLIDAECCSGSCSNTHKCRRAVHATTAPPADAALNAALNACIKLSTDTQAPDQCPAVGPLDPQRKCIYNPLCVTGDAADCVEHTGCQYMSGHRLLQTDESETGEDAVNTSTTVTTTGKWAAEDGRVCKKDKANCLIDAECCSGSCSNTNKCRRAVHATTAPPADAALNAALNACIKLSTDAQAPDQCPTVGPVDPQRKCIYNPLCVTGDDAADCVEHTGCQYV